MAAKFTALLLSVLPHVVAQAYDSATRDEDAFSYVQPLNTTILGQYGHSPEVLPSREYCPMRVPHGEPIGLTTLQPMQPESADGRKRSREPGISLRS